MATKVKKVLDSVTVTAGTKERSIEIPLEHVDEDASLEVDVGGGGGGTGAFRVAMSNSQVEPYLVPAGKADILTSISGSRAYGEFTIPPGARGRIEVEETGATNDIQVSAWIAVRSKATG